MKPKTRFWLAAGAVVLLTQVHGKQSSVGYLLLQGVLKRMPKPERKLKVVRLQAKVVNADPKT